MIINNFVKIKIILKKKYCYILIDSFLLIHFLIHLLVSSLLSVIGMIPVKIVSIYNFDLAGIILISNKKNTL